MGITLSLTRDVKRIDFGKGVHLSLRPATSIEHLAAHASAKSLLNSYIESSERLAEIGISGVTSELLTEPDFLIGVSELVLAVELATLIVTGWENVFTTDGSPAPLDRAHLGAFLSSTRTMNQFQRVAYAELAEELDEGNGSGNSSGGAPGEEPNIAGAAEMQNSPAQGASAERMGKGALRSSTSHVAPLVPQLSLH